MKYVSKDIFFTFSKMRIIIIWMRTGMDDAIHVQVKIVKVGDLKLKDSVNSTRDRYKICDDE